MFNGGNIAGATNHTLTLSNAITAGYGSYHVLVTNALGSLDSSNANFYFVTPPVIVAQTTPTNLTADYQSNVVLEVTAVAPGMNNGFPLAYQWQFNGTNIANATGASYRFNAYPGFAGAYSVIISNAAGGTNTGWTLAVTNTSLVLAQSPTNQYQIAGGSVNFAAGGVGLAPVNYQWQFNNVNLTGATHATLTLTNVQSTNEGSYRVAITDGVSSLTSAPASFTLVTPPVITSQSTPTNIVAVFQTNLTLGVTASAPGQTNGFPLNFKWRLNETNVAGGSSNKTIFVDTPTLGNYSVVVTNRAGGVTSLVWQVSMTYTGSYIASGTLAYHLSTNAAAHTNGFSETYIPTMELSGWAYRDNYFGSDLAFLTNAVWSTNFWLKGVQGLSATPIGMVGNTGGQGLMTMISPRHYLFATHMNPSAFLAAFLDTNNVIHWRNTVQRVDIPKTFTYGISNDISVGILDADLPPSVGFLPVLPTNYTNYLPTNFISYVQGIGMNQDMRIFSQPMMFGGNVFANWDTFATIPFGASPNWSVAIRTGDSSNPEMILVGNQLVLVSHNFTSGSGPNYALQVEAINQYMHYLSTNNAVGTDYQLTPFSLTNWPTIR